MRVSPHVLLLEDLPDTQSWLSGIVLEVNPEARITVAGTVAEALEALPTRCWGLMLIDLGLPDGSGVAFLRALRAPLPGVPAIVTTIYDDDDNLFGALAAGASGYLLKSQPRALLVQQLALQRRGHVPISPSIARRLMAHFRQVSRGAGSLQETELTPREIEVLELIAQGLRTREVAAQLGLTEYTVTTYIRELYDKLGVGNRAEAARAAARLGLRQP